MALGSIQATAQAKAQSVNMSVSCGAGGCNHRMQRRSQAMRVQSEPARLDDRRSIVVLDAAGRDPAPPSPAPREDSHGFVQTHPKSQLPKHRGPVVTGLSYEVE